MELLIFAVSYLIIGISIGIANVWFYPQGEDVVSGSVILVFLWLPLLGTAIVMGPVMLLMYLFDKAHITSLRRQRVKRER